jgi:hypothetical protein
VDDLKDVAVVWKSVTSTVIQNCFSKCVFGTEDAVWTEEEGMDDSDGMELQCQVDCPSNFKDFMKVKNMILMIDD